MYRTDPSWQDRYNSTSTTGRIYTRRMVYRRCMAMCGAGNGPGVRRLLDDPEFMGFRTGMVPSAIAHDVWSTLARSGSLVIEPFEQWKARRQGGKRGISAQQ